MSTMINMGEELLRISPKDSRKLEYSKNDGRSWIPIFGPSSNAGEFQDLIDNGEEILATTSKGLFRSKNEGRSWVKRN